MYRRPRRWCDETVQRATGPAPCLELALYTVRYENEQSDDFCANHWPKNMADTRGEVPGVVGVRLIPELERDHKWPITQNYVDLRKKKMLPKKMTIRIVAESFDQSWFKALEEAKNLRDSERTEDNEFYSRATLSFIRANADLTYREISSEFIFEVVLT